MAALADGHVLTSSVRRVVGGMSVGGGHGVPERAPCLCEAADRSARGDATTLAFTDVFAMAGEDNTVVAARLLAGLD